MRVRCLLKCGGSGCYGVTCWPESVGVKIKNSLSVLRIASAVWVKQFHLSPQATQNCAMGNVLPASYGLSEPGLQGAEANILDVIVATVMR